MIPKHGKISVVVRLEELMLLKWPYYPKNGEGDGTPLQYSCLENPMDGGAWQAAVHRIAELDTTDQLHFHFSLSCIGKGNGNPLQCSCLEDPRDGGAWWAAVYGVTQSQTQLKRLSSSSSIRFFKSIDLSPGSHCFTVTKMSSTHNSHTFTTPTAVSQCIMDY